MKPDEFFTVLGTCIRKGETEIALLLIEQSVDDKFSGSTRISKPSNSEDISDRRKRKHNVSLEALGRKTKFSSKKR